MMPIQNPPPPPIGQNTNSNVVANLQDTLLFLIEKERLRLSDDERRALLNDREGQVYRDGTSRAVTAFREQFQLEPGEIVDEPTANALNRLLQELGAFDTPQAEWIVRGQIVDANGPINDIRVSVFDRDLFFRRRGANTGQQLGTEVTRKLATKSEDGCFEFSYRESDFAAGDSIREGHTIPDLVFALSKDGEALEKFQVFRLPDGNGMAEETLVSDDDLILGFQSRRMEVVRIVIPNGEPKPQMSEYERLWRGIEPLLPERAPADADDAQREALVCAAASRFDENTHRDVSFVARETKLDRLSIQRFANACRLAVDPFQNSLSASVFYALASISGVSDVLTLARLSTNEMRTALHQATVAAPPLIPMVTTDRIKEIVRTIRDVLASYLPAYRPAEGAASLADLVGADLPDPDEQATLWRTFSDHKGTPAEFWEKLRSQPGFGDPEKIGKVQYSFQLGMLAQNHIPLVKAIRATHPTIADTRELAFELDTQEKWTALLNRVDVPIPEDVPGKPEDRKANYAASLAGAIQIAHPTVAVANMVASLPREQLANVQPAVAKFLADAVRQTQFDLVSGRINDLVAEHGDSLLKDIDEQGRPAVIGQVKRLQRLFRLSVGPESMKALVEAGFNSARDLAELSPEVAMNILTPMLGEATARLVLNRANNISAAAIHQYVFLNDAINGDVPGGAI